MSQPSSPKIPLKEIATNRKAHHDFEIIDKVECGMELKGTEVKSVRDGRINLKDAFARIEAGQVILYGCDIQPYARASWENHDPKRPRRLLLNRREIDKLYGTCQVKGLTLVALRAYWKARRVKLELGVGRGKHQADRRQDLKDRVENREMQRAMHDFNRR
jgi:SsrA-binding protein